MLSREDNELLCRVGPGTPMGNLMRQYWVPAALSSELPAAGRRRRCACACWARISSRFRDDLRRGRPDPEQLPAPRRQPLLRPQRGRGPALRLPRLEVRRRPASASTCRASPPRATSSRKVRATAYPCVERGGLIWAYLGPRATPPPLPDLEPNMLAEGSSVFRSTSASATGCRRSRATSTPATRCSCTSVT